MKLRVLKGDITTLAVDAIVNAANTLLAGGGGVDGAIHRVGGPAIAEACAKIRKQQGGCPTGQAVITPAGWLPCRYVIHAVGPIWRGEGDEDKLLAGCYANSLRLAVEYGLKCIAFPNISTGVYGFPKERAAQIALDTVRAFEEGGDIIKEVSFVCFDEENHQLYCSLLD